jgi:hypothetical protein
MNFAALLLSILVLLVSLGILSCFVVGFVRRSKTLLGAGVVLALTCWLIMEASDRNVSGVVRESQVVGTWELSPESYALFHRDGYRGVPAQTHTIRFRADGTCFFASVRYEVGEPAVYLESAGTWQLQHQTTSPRNTLRLRLHPRPDFTDESELLFTHDVFDALRLWTYYGDPDEGEFVEYARLR